MHTSLKAVESENGNGLQDAIDASRARKERKRQRKAMGLEDIGSPGSDFTGRGRSRAISDSGSDDDMPRKRGRPSASVEPLNDGDDDRSVSIGSSFLSSQLISHCRSVAGLVPVAPRLLLENSKLL